MSLVNFSVSASIDGSDKAACTSPALFWVGLIFSAIICPWDVMLCFRILTTVKGGLYNGL